MQQESEEGAKWECVVQMLLEWKNLYDGSGNKMSCFYIQNLVPQRKHLDSTKHMKETNKHMKKNHIERERNNTVAMVHVALTLRVDLDVLCVFSFTCFYIICWSKGESLCDYTWQSG